MNILEVKKNGELLIPYVEDASNFVRRFMGLMFRKSIPQDHGLLLTPCNEIHTFNMKFDIDTITLDKDGVVLFIDESVPPRKARKSVKNGHCVLELNAFKAKELGIQLGDKLEFTVKD